MTVSARAVRQVVQKQGTALGQILPTVQQLAHNDAITQQRMEAHERRLDAFEAFQMFTFWQRVIWLLTGRY